MKAECAKLDKGMKEDCSGCIDTVIPPGGGGPTPPTTSELPSFIPQSALNVITQEKPELVNIDYLYDIGGDSIFAPNMQGLDEDGNVGPALDGNPYRTSAKKGGMIRNQNAVDTILELLKGK